MDSQIESPDYKAWYDEAMVESNKAGFVGLSAAETIRELALQLAAARTPVTSEAPVE